MKHFKLMKGMLACLLSLALVVSCFYTGANAATFKVTYDGKEYTNDVDTSAATEDNPTVVSVTSALSGMTTTVSGESVPLDGVEFDASKQSPGSASGGWTYSSTSGFVISSSGAEIDVAVKAAKSGSGELTATYNPLSDTVTFTSDKEGKVYFAADSEATATLKKAKFSSKDLVKGTDNSYSVTIELNDKKNGVKVAEKNALNIFATTTEPASTATEYKAILSVAATTVNTNVKITFNYGSVGKDVSAFVAKAGETTYTGSQLSYRRTTDGGKGKDWTEWDTADGLTGVKLAEVVNGANKKEIYQFRVVGTDTTRSSKIFKAKADAAGKAPKVKLDYAKGTVAIKNGFQYVVRTSALSGDETIAADEWITVLPQNKDATKVEATITGDYTPVKKFSATDPTAVANFTKTKVKTIPVADLVPDGITEGSIWIYVRKAPTASKPATAYTAIEKIAIPVAAPTFTSVSGEKAKNDIVFKSSAFATGYEYMVIDKDTTEAQIAAAKWTKLDSGITLDKSNTKIGSDKKVLGVGSIVLVRKAGVKNTSLPSFYVKTTIKKVTGSGSGETDAYIWEECPAESGETSESGKCTVTYTVSISGEGVASTSGANVTVVNSADAPIESGSKVEKDTKIKVTVAANEGYTLSDVAVTKNEDPVNKEGGKNYYEITIDADVTIAITATAVAATSAEQGDAGNEG